LINPHYGINDRQPTNPLTDNSIDIMTPFLQAMISNQKQNQQQITTPQPKPKPKPQPQPVVITQPPQQQPQPVVITQPKQPKQPKQPENPPPIILPKPKPENPPPIILPKPKPEPPFNFTHDDVQNLIEQIHNKQQKEIPEPIPQNSPQKKPVVKDLYGFEIKMINMTV
jgi:hypothetical protein